MDQLMSIHSCAAGFAALDALRDLYGGTAGILRHGPHCHDSPGATHE